MSSQKNIDGSIIPFSGYSHMLILSTHEQNLLPKPAPLNSRLEGPTNKKLYLKVHSKVLDNNSLITESFLKTMKNPFYFTLKALFTLKIFKFLS